MVLTATKQASNRTIEHTTINLYLFVGDRSAYWGGGINVSAMHSITLTTAIHTPPPYESSLITINLLLYVLDDSVIITDTKQTK